MQLSTTPENLPKWLQKDIVSTHYEVPVPDGGSHTITENYYSPQVFRWVLQEWLHCVPLDGDLAALRRALPAVLADSRTFYAYLRVPEAFEEMYRAELTKENQHRAGVRRVKRALNRGSFSSLFGRGALVASLLLADAVAAAIR